MTVDPVDDCTFWFTIEYLKASGSFNDRSGLALEVEVDRVIRCQLPPCGTTHIGMGPDGTRSGGETTIVDHAATSHGSCEGRPAASAPGGKGVA